MEILEGNKLLLKDNVPFNSPSAASNFVCATSTSGIRKWKTKSGVSLKDIEDDILAISEDLEIPDHEIEGKQSTDLIFFCQRNESNAKMKISNEGYILLKGSILDKDNDSYKDGDGQHYMKKYYELRGEFLNEGRAKREDDNTILLLVDFYLFLVVKLLSLFRLSHRPVPLCGKNSSQILPKQGYLL